MPGIAQQPLRPPQGQQDGHRVLVQGPASTMGMGRCCSQDMQCPWLLSVFSGDCCFYLGTRRVVQGVVGIQLRPEAGSSLSSSGWSLAHAHWGQTHPSPLPADSSVEQPGMCFDRQLCEGDENSKDRWMPSAPLPSLRGHVERDPSRPLQLGNMEQPLLGGILLLFPNADAVNGCSAAASVGAVAHPASLGTSGSQRPRFVSVLVGRKQFAQAAQIHAAVHMELDSPCIICWKL